MCRNFESNESREEHFQSYVKIIEKPVIIEIQLLVILSASRQRMFHDYSFVHRAKNPLNEKNFS